MKQSQLLKFVLFFTVTFISSTSFAEANELQTLQSKLNEAQEKLATLTKENGELKRLLAFKEREVAGHRFRLSKIEEEIAALEEKN